MLVMRVRAAVALLVVALAVSACGTSSGGSGGGAASGTRPAGTAVTITVPGDAPTISDAVALARPGDLVLVAPGTYHETVTVATRDVTLRGESRSGVVIDGRLKQSNGIVVTAPGVAVENLTVENNVQNGILITGSARAKAGTPNSNGYDTGDEAVTFLRSFLVSHVTSTRNGLYGIYAFSAQDGVIEDNYVSGGADSGIYVGQCKPCRVLVRGNVAELNAVGFEGTNASGDMYVVGNRLVGNRVGATTDADHQEKLLPQTGAVLAGNLIAANQQPKTPEQADGGWGIGVGVDGGSDNRFVRNRIADNATAGVIVTASQDIPANGNRIDANTFERNGVDVAFTFPASAGGHGNCLTANALRVTLPADLATTATCPQPGTAASPSAALGASRAPAGIPFSQVAAPPAQPEFPNARTAGPTAVPATPAMPVLSSVAVPPPTLLAAHASVAVP